tara:strand:+ start:84 stop:461 length:378 start_codon:yes stop_codon:yes gene_type:complete
MDDYDNKALKSSLDYKKAREERYKEVARNELYQKSRKRIQTTMIGSLAAIEDFFGFLWGLGQEENDITEEQKYMKNIYEKARSRILDKGNTQIDSLEADFAKYEIERRKFYIKLPVNDLGEKNDG